MKSKETKNTVVPKLRFPEFRDAKGWKEYRLNQISEHIDKKVGDLQLITVSITSGIGFVAQVKKFGRDISGEQYKNYIELNAGEFAYNKGYSKKYPQGCVYKLKEFKQIAVPKAFICFRLTKKIVADFFQGYFDNNYHGKQLQKFITSGARSDGLLNVNFNDFFNIILPIPEQKTEQQKIADCLSSLDELISSQNQKLELLKAHKKGLMQQLFPVEGKTMPKLRFPEFRDAGEWKIKSFEDMYLLKATNSFSRDNLNYNDGLIKNIHYGDIHTKFFTFFDIEKEMVPYINTSLSIEKIKQECYCKEGDMIFADASEDLDGIGKSIEIVNLNDEKLLSGLHTLLARQRKNNLIIGFGGYLFSSNGIQHQIQKEAQGAKVLGISSRRLSKIEIYYPQNKVEQQKIANCLYSIDELITAQTQKLELLKAHKNGLMQQLFPNSNTIIK